MLGQGPETLKRLQVLAGGVTFVARKTVLGIATMKRYHLSVARDLGQYRGCANGWMPGISFHHSLVLNMMPGQPIAVHQQVLRCKWQAIDGATHRQVGGMVDIEFIDLGMARLAHSECKRFGTNLDIKLQPALGGQLLRIVQPRNRLHRIEDHRSRNHRPNQRPTPHLINAGQHMALIINDQRQRLDVTHYLLSESSNTFLTVLVTEAGKGRPATTASMASTARARSEERRVGKECKSRW